MDPDPCVNFRLSRSLVADHALDIACWRYGSSGLLPSYPDVWCNFRRIQEEISSAHHLTYKTTREGAIQIGFDVNLCLCFQVVSLLSPATMPLPSIPLDVLLAVLRDLDILDVVRIGMVSGRCLTPILTLTHIPVSERHRHATASVWPRLDRSTREVA